MVNNVWEFIYLVILLMIYGNLFLECKSLRNFFFYMMYENLFIERMKLHLFIDLFV